MAGSWLPTDTPGTESRVKASGSISRIGFTDMIPRSIPVSVIVLTHNEAVNIADCVETLVGVRRESSSSTPAAPMALWTSCEIGFRRFASFSIRFEDFGQQRNWALDHAAVRNDWVLFFDADERCTAECAAAIEKAVAQPDGHDGFFLCYRNMFLGRWIRRSTLFPTWQLRLLRVGKVRYRKEGHGQREVMEGSAGYITRPVRSLRVQQGHQGLGRAAQRILQQRSRVGSEAGWRGGACL